MRTPWYEGKFDSINFNLSNIETQNIKNIKRYENLKNKNESMTKQRAINLVYSSGINLNKLPEKYKKDKDIVLTAVKQDGLSLYWADKSLKEDPDVLKALGK